MHPVGIGETLRRAITRTVMKTERDQAKTARGSLQLCAGLEAGIEGDTHAVAQRRWDRTEPTLGKRLEEALKEDKYGEEANNGRGVNLEAVGGEVEVTDPPAAGNATDEGEGEASDKLRTTMEAMEVQTGEMAKGDEMEAEGDGVDAV